MEVAAAAAQEGEVEAAGVAAVVVVMGEVASAEGLCNLVQLDTWHFWKRCGFAHSMA